MVIKQNLFIVNLLDTLKYHNCYKQDGVKENLIVKHRELGLWLTPPRPLWSLFKEAIENHGNNY